MAARAVPERAGWASKTLAVAPSDQVLEIGCGRGTLVSLLCEQLVDGKIIALDRSVTMVRLAEQRNAAHVAAGRAEFRVTEFATAGLVTGQFDKVCAVNVNLFWVRPAGNDLSLVRRVLKPGGALCLCYELPVRARAQAVTERLRSALTAQGFTTTFAHGVTKRQHALLSVLARPAG